MNSFEEKITAVFIERYSGSGPVLRLRADSVFPEFDTLGPDDKESFLEAAENLEKQGLLHLVWEKRAKRERLKTLTCINMKKLFALAGRPYPETEAEKARTLIENSLPELEAIFSKTKIPQGKFSGASAQNPRAEADRALAFLHWLAANYSPANAKRGMDSAAMRDFISFIGIFLEPEQWKTMTTRALSVRLFRDSKRLEYVLDFVSPFLAQAEKQGAAAPDFSILRRSFPEAAIMGKLVFEHATRRTSVSRPPLENSGGVMLSLPLPAILEMRRVRTVPQKRSPRVLTVENKETFYVLGPELNGAFDCCLYSGGFPSRAAAAMVRLLAASGFSFFHAGDLDIDGILILQNIMDIAGKPVTPLRMDAETFDRYLPWGRLLSKEMFRQTEKIREETRAIPGIAPLISRIEETSRGIEQEIIDYSGRG